MKKGIGLFLSCLLAITMVSSALATSTSYYFEEAGLTIEVPDTFTVTDGSEEDYYALVIVDTADTSAFYSYVVGYEEEFSGRFIEDLSEEEIQELMDVIFAEQGDFIYEGVEGDEYPVIFVYDEARTQLHIVGLLNGWLTDMFVMNPNEEALTEAQAETAAKLLLSVTFDSDTEE